MIPESYIDERSLNGSTNVTEEPLTGNTTEIDTHRFEPYLPTAHFWTIKVLTAVLIVLSVVFNSVALISILKFFCHFNASCRFVINLLITDLLFSAVYLCRFLLGLVPRLAQSRELCLGFFSGMLCTGSTVQLSLLLALVDNFITVVFPFRYRNIITCRLAHAAIAVIWVYSISVMVLLPNLDIFNDWRSYHACEFNRVIAESFRAILAVQFGSTSLVMAGLYLKILMVAVSHHRKLVKQGDRLPTAERNKIRERCHNVQFKGLLALCFFICWLPFCLLQTLDGLLSPLDQTILSSYVNVFVGFNTAVNPVVCVWRNRHFRKALTSFRSLQRSAENITISVLTTRKLAPSTRQIIINHMQRERMETE